MLKFIGFTFPHPSFVTCQRSEYDRKWPEAGVRELCYPPFPCTQQQCLLDSQHQEVSAAGVILNVTTAFLGRNCSWYFFANCSEVKYVFMHSPPHSCICIIWISQKQKQSFKSWKFWRIFCSKDFWPFTFNIPAFSSALCTFHGSSPMKTHNLNCYWRINCEQLPLLSSYRRGSHVIIWGLFGSLSEWGMVKDCS